MTSKGVKKDDDAKTLPRFLLRVARKVFESRQRDSSGMLLTVCAFAGVAECFNELVTPSFSFRGVDITGTFCNLSGSWAAGLALTFGARGARSSALSDAFRGGFVTAYTSFCHVVEHHAALHCGRRADSAALLFLLSAIFGGPLCFDLGRRMGRVIFRPPLAAPATDATAVGPALLRARLLLALLLALALVVCGVARGYAACLQLFIAAACAAAACQAGDVIIVAAAELMESHGFALGAVNWGTIWANAAALMMVVACSYSTSLWWAVATALPPSGAWLLLTLAEKFRSSFCGALSAYGAFSEDAATMLAQKQADSAAASLGMNTLLFVVACALLAHAECPLGGVA